MDTALAELQQLIVSIAAAAVTALAAWAFAALRTYLGIKESDANEAAIRRAALTEAGKLIQTGGLDDPAKIAASVAKVLADLHPQVHAEEYTAPDVKDMIIGAAATAFPPLKLLQLLK